MCGIAGIFSVNKEVLQKEHLQKMANSMAHRGPDGEGYYLPPEQPIALAHRRLAVLDLSEKATQPLHYRDRYIIVHNGEIYNYIELRKSLEQLGHKFFSASDTEVIAAAFAEWKEACLEKLNGMFAFAIWDQAEQQLFIARDRFGEKPLYYYLEDKCFYFASEMKAFWAVGIPKTINQSLMSVYLGLGYTSIPLQPEITFYKNIFSLPPAHYLWLDGKATTNSFVVSQQQYWDLDKVTTTPITEQEAVAQFSDLLQKSIQLRLRSDVPIGTSLSGGVDSSSIAAFLHEFGCKNLQSFSAVFPGYARDESAFIQQVNNHLTLEGKSIQPSIENFMADFDRLITVQEQPFISSSIFAQYKVFELAKQNHTTVLMDGQGADETLGGYTKYIHWYLQELWLFDKKNYASAVKQLKENYNFSFGWKNKMAAWFPAPAANQLEKKAKNQIRWNSGIQQEYVDQNFSGALLHKPMVKKLNDLLYFNTMQFGLEELLRYADKNAMAHGVEVRLPFLSHDLVQFVFSLPATYKIRNGYLKWMLRKTIDKKLPESIVWRKDKIGYETPEQEWLSHPFFTEKIRLAKEKLVAQGILHKKVLVQPAANPQNWRWLIASAYIN